MKRIDLRKVFAAGVAVIGLAALSAGIASADATYSSATASASASASVVTAIGISKTTDMNFGQVVAGATEGTVVLSTAGVRTTTGGTKLGNDGGKTQAVFHVTGQGTDTFAITLPSSISITSGANSMTVDTFTSDPSGTGTLVAGALDVNVGATLHVGASQASGDYSGTFNVTVAYN